MSSERFQTCRMLLAFAIALSSTSLLRGADPAAVNWKATTITGVEVKVPAADRPSLIAFLRADQEQSKSAVKEIRDALKNAKSVQVVVVVSGPTATEFSKTMAAQLPAEWATVADVDFGARAALEVRVWPTTVIVQADGKQLAHIGGMPPNFAAQLQAYLEQAAGKIDDQAVQKRLESHEVVSDSPAQIAARHLQVAQRLAEQGYLQQAEAEVKQLKDVPSDPATQLALARLDLMINHPIEALAIIDKIPAGSVPAWQTSLIRGRANIALNQWDQAKTVLPEALKLNPDPAEAHYLLGLCYQHDNDATKAAEQFKLAFEKSASGQKLRLRP